ncbi:DUF2178 domain-containing protein [archaeon]|jgi:hypothetical protein|nr:DUF2178 domain-containing protein [archaeon]MBT4352292.1 DUF2178 domain-containing protein [archaeon]MBT4647961.1 DUF2178 domain-containing protein [archaeon]MBT7391343.1 DUF2178 domain-containing protein [archaeon]
MDKKIRIIMKYCFGIFFIVLGLLFNVFKIGNKEYLGFTNTGNWLLYIGLISIIINTLQIMKKKKRIVDERMLLIASKANRIVFLSIVILAFVLMIVNGIKTITIPYSMFMSYLVCFMMLVYFISYKILLKYN